MNKFKFLKKTLIFVLLVLFASFIVNVEAANIELTGPEIIYANPGEDCSTQITVSWHAPKSECDFYYTVATDTEFAEAEKMTVSGIYNSVAFTNYDVAKYYKFSVALTELTPDTKYIYKIICANAKSGVRSFKTAGTSDFTFGYMSDIHAVPYDNLDLGMTAVKKLQTVQKLLDKSTEVSGELSFILTTGDEVWRGSQYSNWQEWNKTQYTTATADYLWFSCPGNHEYYTQTNSSVWNYYPDKYASNTSAIYSDPQYFYNTYFNQVKSVPQNGAEGVSSSYWSIYNNVLFICIDSMQASEYNKLKQLRTWFEKVCIENEGSYQYIITYQHYPWYDFQTGEDKHANKWSDLFDKYGVDLALSGHMHGYLRTKSLYEGKECTEEGKGTVYVVSPQVGDRPKVITDYQNENLIANRQSTRNFEAYSAMSTISVTKEGLTYKLVDVNGEVKDEFTVKARRSFASSDNVKQDIIDSLSVSATSNTITVDMKKSLASYVENIKLSVDQKTFRCYPAEKKVTFVTAKDLNSNPVHDLTITVKFADGSTYEKTIKVVTTSYYGLINKVDVEASNNMKLVWEASDNNVVKSYKVYVDDNLKETLSADKSSYEVDKSSISFDTKYTLEALDNNGVIVYRTDVYYGLYGDINLDGAVNKTDVNVLIEKILGGYSFNEFTTKLLDNNGDNVVDIGDAYRILALENQLVERLVEHKYDVIFIDEEGKTIGKSTVYEGEDAVAPEPPVVEGKNFVGWSASYYNIKSDIIIRAIYE